MNTVYKGEGDHFAINLDQLSKENLYFYLYSILFFILNVICDLLLSVFRSSLPHPILKADKSKRNEENLKQLSTKSVQGNPFRSTSFLSTTTADLFQRSIERGYSIGEWKINLICLEQTLIIGLSSNIILYLHPDLIITNRSQSFEYLSNTLILLNSLKTGHLLYKVLFTAIRYVGDNSIGLILNSSIQVLFIIVATLHRNSNFSNHKYIQLIVFANLLDLQLIFHFFKRALIFIQLSDSVPYSICNAFNLILIVSIRPFVHFHQLKWLYRHFEKPGFKFDYLQFLACLTTALQVLDTFFLLFDYLMVHKRSRKQFDIETKKQTLKDNTFNKLRRFDSDTEMIYF